MKTTGRSDSSLPTAEMPRFAGRDHQRGADAGERGHQQQRRRRRSDEDGAEQEQHPGRAAGILPECGPRHRKKPDRQQRAQRQLPCPERREVEYEGGVPIADRERRRKGQRGGDGEQQPGALRRDAPGQQHQQRDDEVELLLHAERPGMQQRFGFGGRVEIAGGAREVDIRDGADRAGQAPGIILEFDRQAVEIGQNAGDQEHDEQGGQDAQDPSLVEVPERERSLADVRIDHAADQISRYDEEDIDADEAARKAGNAGVVEQHRNNGERPQAIDVGAVFHRTRDQRDGDRERHRRTSRLRRRGASQNRTPRTVRLCRKDRARRLLRRRRSNRRENSTVLPFAPHVSLGDSRRAAMIAISGPARAGCPEWLRRAG